MKKKIFSVGLILAMTICVLAGCDDEEETKLGPGETTIVNGTVMIIDDEGNTVKSTNHSDDKSEVVTNENGEVVTNSDGSSVTKTDKETETPLGYVNQGNGDNYAVDIFTDAAQENTTTKADTTIKETEEGTTDDGWSDFY